MRKLRHLDYRLLSELIKNAKRSDRELAKTLGSSQPTITRARMFLEKELIEGYTAIPKWHKLGYNLLAITLIKTPLKYASGTKKTEAYERSMKWLLKQPNVIMGSGCRGMGMTDVMISLHKTYPDLDAFLTRHREQLADFLEDVQTIVVNMSGKTFHKPLDLKYLAEAFAHDFSKE